MGSASGSRPHLPEPTTVDFFNAYSQFIFGFQSSFINTILLSAWPIVMLIALLGVRKSRGVPIGIRYMLTMATLPILLAFVISLVITPFFLSRYMVATVAPLIIVFTWLFSQYSRRMVPGLVAVLFVVTFLSSFQQAASSKNPVKEDYRSVAQYVNRVAQPQDLVVLSAPFTVYPFEYYYEGQAQIQTLPFWDQGVGKIPGFDAKKLPAEVAAQNKNHRYIYLVLSQDQGYEKTIRQYYLTHFKQIKRQTYSPDLTLYVYQVGYYKVPTLSQNTEPVKQ